MLPESATSSTVSSSSPNSPPAVALTWNRDSPDWVLSPLTAINPTSRIKKIAIIGSGVSGIAALWALNRTAHDVYLYEAADRLGGHTNTVEYKHGKFSTRVDTGFNVLNTASYPNFSRFLKTIGVRTAPTDMTFGVSRDNGAFEWSGASLSSVFAQRRNVLSPRFWRMMFDVIRFNQFAIDVLQKESEGVDHMNGNGHARKPSREEGQETIGRYLEREGYSEAFRDDYLIPIAAAVWNTSPETCSLEFPASTLVRFMYNNHLLNTFTQRPEWRTLPDGSKSYIDAVMRGFPPNHVFLNTTVHAVANDEHQKVRIHLNNNRSELYDHVVIATHGDQAYSLVKENATSTEHAILSSFQTSRNSAILHNDLSLMPRLRPAWAAWNYITESSDLGETSNIDQVCLTYNMNILQHIPRDVFGDVLVTLNPLRLPKHTSSHIQGRYEYQTPLFTPASVRAQVRLPEIQNTRGISYCGAWTGYGSHEDGFSSGLLVARDYLGARLPIEFTDSTVTRGQLPRLSMVDLLMRMAIMVLQYCIVLLEGLVNGSVSRGKRKMVMRKQKRIA